MARMIGRKFRLANGCVRNSLSAAPRHMSRNGFGLFENRPSWDRPVCSCRSEQYDMSRPIKARTGIRFETFKSFSSLMIQAARTLEIPDNEANYKAIKCNILSNFLKNRFLYELAPICC